MLIQLKMTKTLENYSPSRRTFALSTILLMCAIADAFLQPPSTHHHLIPHYKHHRIRGTSSLCMSSTTQQLNQAILTNKEDSFDRSTAQEIVSNVLCPKNEERKRNNAGMEAFGQDRNSKVITNDDPRNEYAYDEFPFDSFDVLVNRAVEVLDEATRQEDTGCKRKMIDLGSGSGRLALYAGFTRSNWDVVGIEIGHQLHSLAVNSLQRGIEEDFFKQMCDDSVSLESDAQLSFYNGNVLLGHDPYFQETESDNGTIQSILSEANLLFAYSTVWEAESFNPDLGAMVLSSKWSQTLAKACQNGTVAITTDRVLNPDHGWKLLDRMDVENPSVWGSVGYISMLQK